MEALSASIQTKLGWTTRIPNHAETVTL